MTYYWIGLVFSVHLFVTIAVLLSRSETMLAEYENYLLHLLPLAAATALIRTVVLRHLAYPNLKQVMNKGTVLQWKPLLLVLGTWPVYLLAWFLAIFRIPVSFLPTPKEPAGHGPNLFWIWPQILTMMALFVGIFVTHWISGFQNYLLLLAFTATLAIGQLGVLVQAWRESVNSKHNLTPAL